jgi:dolichyl-phosphate beta-glucosyltransferase
MKLSILIPAYNEEDRLPATLAAYLAWFGGRYPGEFEIIVVVNGSTDRTAEVARELARGQPMVRVIVEPGKIGKGGAILRGMDAARGALIGFVDADGATPPEAFEALVQAVEGDALALANRWHPESIITPQPWPRRVTSVAFHALIRTLFHLRVRDTQCGAKVWTRRVQEAIRPKIGLTQWAFDVDLLFQTRRAGFRLIEIPTVWNDQPGTRLRLARASLEMFIAVWRLRLLYSHLRWIVTLYDHTLGLWTHPRR